MNKNRYLALLSFYRNLSSILKFNFKELYLSSFLYPISSNVKRNISFLDRLKNKYTIAVKNLLFSIGFFLTVDRDMNWLMVQYTAPKCQTLINIYVLKASQLNFPSLKSNLSLMQMKDTGVLRVAIMMSEMVRFSRKQLVTLHMRL